MHNLNIHKYLPNHLPALDAKSGDNRTHGVNTIAISSTSLKVHRPRRRTAFTLVELLVTVAIIGLILSIMLPALGRARDSANLTMCRTRLRNVAIACNLYANENLGRFPVDNMLGPGCDDSTNSHTALINTLTLGGYLPCPENLFCPSEKSPDLSFSQENLDNGVIGYFYFSCKLPAKNQDISAFLRWDVKWPRLLRNDIDQKTWVISDLWLRGRPTSHYWHQKAVNYAALDNSVQMVYSSPRKYFR
jgi:prepilin-type N-terminal cleavage/methylation domain-containing protein